jgi:hypothetical protein
LWTIVVKIRFFFLPEQSHKTDGRPRRSDQSTVEWKIEKPFVRRCENLIIGLLGTVGAGTTGLLENKKKI